MEAKNHSKMTFLAFFWSFDFGWIFHTILIIFPKPEFLKIVVLLQENHTFCKIGLSRLSPKKLSKTMRFGDENPSKIGSETWFKARYF